MASPETIRDLYDFLAATYGPSKFPPATEAAMHAWYLVLDQVDDEQLGEAVMAHCREESWPPAPADLIRRCGGERRYADRAHRPMELTSGEPTERTASTKALLEQTRAHLGNVVDLDERRSS